MKLIGKFLFLVLISFLSAVHGQDQEPTKTPTTCVDGVTVEFRGFSTGVEPFLYNNRNPICVPGYSGRLRGGGAIPQTITHDVECPDDGNDCLVLSRNIEDYFNGTVRRTYTDVQTFFNALRIYSTSYTAVDATLAITGVYRGVVAEGPNSSAVATTTNTDTYRLILKDGQPVLSGSTMSTGLDVLGSTPFSSIDVTDVAEKIKNDVSTRFNDAVSTEINTIRSVVIEFDCSGGRPTKTA